MDRNKMFIMYKFGKYDQKIMGIFILLKEYVKSWGATAPLPPQGSTPVIFLNLRIPKSLGYCENGYRFYR